MRVLKVVAEGITTSFRYPHFMQQVHPTFPMPPPATIYGHICSVLGEWFEPEGVRFAYHFTHSGRAKDLEHIIVLSPASGTLPGSSEPKALEGNVNPFQRDLLFRPRLALYLNRPDWEPAFRSPRYPVVLGRSQDLFTYTSVEVVDLELAERAYFEHTLAPHDMALLTQRGVTMLMPRYLDYARQRAPSFGHYLVLEERVLCDGFIRLEGRPYGPYWTDPSTPQESGAHLGLAFLTFVGDPDAGFRLA